MSKIIVPNYTQVPNVVIDDLAAKLSDSAFKIYVVLIRKTKGWEQKRDAIAISQFCELTGKSKPTVIKALDELCNLGLIKKTRFTKHGNEYELNLSFSHDGVFIKLTSKKSLLVKKFDIKSKEILLLKVKKFDTQQTLSKDTIKETNINKAKVKKFNPKEMDLPPNVDYKLWCEFVDMRSDINKKLPERSAKMILSELESFGVTANESLSNAIKATWLKPYAVKQNNYQQQPVNNTFNKLGQLADEWDRNNADYTPY